MKTIIASAVVVLVAAGCAAEGNHAEAILEANGLQNIEFDGSGNPLLDCTSFKAVTFSGKPVSGDVCYSWIEGQVVSFD